MIIFKIDKTGFKQVLKTAVENCYVQDEIKGKCKKVKQLNRFNPPGSKASREVANFN